MHEEQNMRSQIKEKKNNSGTETNRTLRYLVSFLVIIGLLVVLFFWNIGVGSVEMSFFDFLGVLTKHQPDSTLYQIVWKIRLPRIIAAVLLGGALSVSGFLLQSFFQNPIAGPYVLGISSGAKLVVALTMIFLLEKGIMVSSLGMVVAAFAGSLLGICPSDFVSGIEYVAACSVRYPDWLYLFGDYGFLCDVCGRFQYCQSSQLVDGKFFRYELGAHPHHGHNCWNHGCDYLRACKTNQCLSDGRILCQKYGRKRKSTAHCTDFTVKSAVGMCDRVCRTDFVCRNCGAASD